MASFIPVHLLCYTTLRDTTMLDEEHQQHTAQLQWRPDRSVEHVVVLCEAGIVAETNNAER